MNRANKIGIVGALRGFAALAVCWYHFTSGQNSWVKWTGHYGWLGVHIFFVISGFIIPYSLYRSGYHVRDFFRFTGKRLARLHPPYLASVVVVLVLGYAVALVPHWHAQNFDVSAPQLLFHFFYLNDLVGRPWFNVVYWTLGIELQWYLLLGLAFPLFTHRRWTSQVAGVLLLLLGYRLFPNVHVIFHSVPIFLIGVFVFQYRCGISSIWRTLASIGAMFALMKTPIGLPVAIVSSITGLLIAFASQELKWLNRLGEVSYSLYLLHLPVGLLIIDFASRLPYSGSYIALIDIGAVALCIWVSSAFYRLVEGPSQRWSSSIKLRGERRSSEAFAPAVAAGD